jgi:transcriptional regulator with XRE-family HTH domain
MSAPSRLSETFATVIKKRRLRAGLSQEALAEVAKVHHTYISMLERGKCRPTIEVAERIAGALGKRLSSLIAEAERTNQK